MIQDELPIATFAAPASMRELCIGEAPVSRPTLADRARVASLPGRPFSRPARG